MRQHAEGRARPLGAPGMPEAKDAATGAECVGFGLSDGEPGAPSGRALPRRKAPPNGIPFWAAESAIFFVTICCAARGKNQLCEPGVGKSLIEAAHFRHDRGNWYLHLLVLMPDHLHLLVSFPRDKAMKKVIGNFKEMTAKSSDIVWQQNFFDHRLRSGESFDEKAHYVRMNPVRMGLVTRLEDWRYSWTPANPARPAVAPYLP